MKHIKNTIIIIMLSFMLFALTGCEFFDVQKEQQEVKEGTIKYLNNKYSVDKSFEKYERNDLKKALDTNSSIGDFALHTVCSDNVFCNFTYKASEYMLMKDGTIVYKNETDNRQANEIKNDFEKYFLEEYFGDYNYTDINLTYLSSLNRKSDNDNGQFKEYYNGKNIDEYIRNTQIYAEGNIYIWIEPSRWESACYIIKDDIKNARPNLNFTGNVYFLDINMRNQFNSSDLNNIDQEWYLGYLEIDKYSFVKHYKNNNEFNKEVHL